MSKTGTGDLFGCLPAAADDWPEDYEDQFWAKWPRHPRKHSQKQVFEKLARIRRDGGIKNGKKLIPVTWVEIWGGLCAYVDSNPEHKFIPCPVVWVNGGRWVADYSRPASDTQQPRRGFGDVAFGRRG